MFSANRPSSPTGGAGDAGGEDGGGSDPHNDPRKFDSTGMFHWCPEQPLSTCLVVSIAQPETEQAILHARRAVSHAELQLAVLHTKQAVFPAERAVLCAERAVLCAEWAGRAGSTVCRVGSTLSTAASQSKTHTAVKSSTCKEDKVEKGF